MSEQENKQEKEQVTEQVVEKTAETKADSKNGFNSDVVGRILLTFLFGLVGWLSLWVFAIVVMVQFGFLLITGELNNNLKAFNKEVSGFLTDILKFVSFQTEEKPFPFRAWNYGDKKSNTDSNQTA